MKAFRSFYKRHCAGARRRSGFGDGGNPSLYNSMGYEFCPSGQGGVLGFNSTGLFPSPCTSYSSSAPIMSALSAPTKVSEGGFGARKRSTRRKSTTRRYNVPGSPCNRLRKRVCHSNPNCSYTKRGCRRRSGTAKGGMVYEGPSLAFGRRRRRSAAVGVKRRSAAAGVKRRSAAAGVKRRSATGVRRRSAAAGVKRRRRRSTTIGTRRR